jgi:RES domain-containing protein
MIVYRIAKGRYINDISGFGAKKYGGRWNNVGIAMLYTSENISLSVLENLANANKRYGMTDFNLAKIKIDSDLIEEIKTKNLDLNWKLGLSSQVSRLIGDNWIRENKNLVLKVPSAIVDQEYNYLINPEHKDFNKVKIISVTNFKFDERLFS